MKLFIKNMVCIRCTMAVQDILNRLGLRASVVRLGEVEIEETVTPRQRGEFGTALQQIGLELIEQRRNVLIEKIRSVVVQLVHNTDHRLDVTFSSFLSKELGYDYTYLANIFSIAQGITIEKFIIHHRVARVKELLVYGELTITEIAYKVHYSSVSHLSNQFKKITGLTPSRFRQQEHPLRVALENV